MVQASSYPDTLRFRFPLFPSYYGNWQIYVTNEIFCLKPLIPCLLLPPILLLSTTNSARLGKWAVQSSPLLAGSVAGINPCCKDITHQERSPNSQILMLPSQQQQPLGLWEGTASNTGAGSESTSLSGVKWDFVCLILTGCG